MKYTTPKELLDSGLIFEINRRVLHPLGLALAVDQESDEVRFSNDVWDNRDNPEDPGGIAFAPETFLEGEAKLQRYMDQHGTAEQAVRHQVLGYVVQTRKAMVAAGELEG